MKLVKRSKVFTSGCVLATSLLFGLLSMNAAGQTVDDQSLVKLRRHTQPALALPLNPVQTLTDEIGALSAQMGFFLNPAQAVVSSGITPILAGRLANVLRAMKECDDITGAHFATLTIDVPTIYKGQGLDPKNFADIRPCAQVLWTAVADLELTLNTQLSLGPTDVEASVCVNIGNMQLDVWPVIRFEGSCTNTTYRNDYLLLVDAGGSDTYINNVGSNMVDLNFAPASSAVMGVRGRGDAKGCQRAIPGLAAGDCTPTAAVLLDMRGRDTFGVKQPPDHDAGARRTRSCGAWSPGASASSASAYSSTRPTRRTST